MRAPRPTTTRVANFRPWVPLAFGFPLLMLLVLPLIALVLRTPPLIAWRYLQQTGTQQAIMLSLRTSVVSVAAAVLLGTPLAYLLARSRTRLATLLDVLVDLPTVLPPAVAGLALLITFGRRGLLGDFLAGIHVQLAFTTTAVILAQVFVSAPYYIKTAALGLSGIGDDLAQAAALDGATPWGIFVHIMIPLAWRGLINGVALCWARALGEFGATILFAGNFPGRTQTMPLAVYLGFEVDLGQALTLAAILLGLSFGILIVMRAMLRHPSGEG